MKKNINILLILIMMILLVFGCSLDQTNSNTDEKSTDQKPMQSANDNTKAVNVKYLVNKTTLLRIIHTYYQDYIEVSSLNELQVIYKHAVALDAQITLNGNKVNLYDLQKGDLLTIYYINDKKKTAKKIAAKRVIIN